MARFLSKLLLISLVTLLIAAATLSAEPESPGEEVPPSEPVQQRLETNSLFTFYKANYALPYARVLEQIDGRKDIEIKYQISVKQPVREFGGFQLAVGYTQKSFWQAYAKSNSSPFRETNYNPEIFLKTPAFDLWQAECSGIFGYEHESNGQSVEKSRSWDRIYFRLLYNFEGFQVNYKIWYRIPERKKENPDDAGGNDNPDIHHYYGYSELMMDFKWGELLLELFGRLNAIEKKGAIQIDLTFPVPGNRVFWYFQYWNGYGESLIDYNRRITRVSLGIMATRNNF